ncbi:MAG: CBS domain-containing protein, partial [Cyanophyceae cyanobacterium]
MDVILCHLTADFDTLGAAVGAAHLYPGSRIVLAGGSHPQVRQFLGLHRNGLPLIALKAVDPAQVRRLILVDCADPARLGAAARWLQDPEVEVHIFDHHPVCADRLEVGSRFPFPDSITLACIEPVGSTCTLMVERLRAAMISLSPFDITALALGIHADTGSLTFGSTTVRDGEALVWLMQQGLNLDQMATYLEGGLSEPLQALLGRGLQDIQIELVEGYRLGSWLVTMKDYLPGLSSLAMNLLDLADVDILMVGAWQQSAHPRLSLIGRSRHDFAALHEILAAYGGGGHERAAAVTLKGLDSTSPEQILAEILGQIRQRIPKPVRAKQLMSSPVRTIRPEMVVSEAQRVLLRYGHSGVVVVDERARLVGVISRRDIDIALHHGFGHAPVKGYMTSPVETVDPETPINEIRTLMMSRDIGRLPVMRRDPSGEEHLLGIVTRTDVLRHLHELPQARDKARQDILAASLAGIEQLPDHDILKTAAALADQMELRLYLVGGAVRDLLLNWLVGDMDLDLVVDGPYAVDAQSLELGMEGW